MHSEPSGGGGGGYGHLMVGLVGRDFSVVMVSRSRGGGGGGWGSPLELF